MLLVDHKFLLFLHNWQPSRGPPCKYRAISIAGKLMPIPEQQRQTRYSDYMSKLHEPSGPAILQLNVEGLTQPKCEVIQKIAKNNSIAVILLQELMPPMIIKPRSTVIPLLARLTTQNTVLQPLYVTTYPPATEIGRSRVDSAIQWLTISIDGEITITNFYKPPNSPFDPPPQYEHLAIYSGDFNCHHTTWG